MRPGGIADDDILQVGVVSDIHRAYMNWGAYFSGVGRVKYHLCCGDILSRNPYASKQNIQTARTRIGEKYCVEGNHDHEELDRILSINSWNDGTEGTGDWYEEIKEKYPAIAKKLKSRAEKSQSRRPRIPASPDVRLSPEDIKFMCKLKKIGYFKADGFNFAYIHDRYPVPEGLEELADELFPNGSGLGTFKSRWNFEFMKEENINALFRGHTHTPSVTTMDAEGNIDVREVYETTTIPLENDVMYIFGVGSLEGISPFNTKRGRRRLSTQDGSKISFGRLTADVDNHEASVEIIVKNILNN